MPKVLPTLCRCGCGNAVGPHSTKQVLRGHHVRLQKLAAKCQRCTTDYDASNTSQRYCATCRPIVRREIEVRYRRSENGRANNWRRQQIWRAANPEAHQKTLEKYWASDKYAATSAAWRQSEAGRASHRAAAARQRLIHPEAVKARVQRWYRETYERERPKYMERARVRKMRQLGAFVEAIDVEEIIRRDRGRCQICSKPVARRDVSIDHILPIARGGTHEPRNVRLAHRRCNSARRDVWPAQLRLVG